MRDEFVLVNSEDELAPGMCVELRPCKSCGKQERMILTHEVRGFSMRDGRLVPNTGWDSVPGDCAGKIGSSFEYAIAQRRLYRLVYDDTAADETATTRRRERVR